MAPLGEDPAVKAAITNRVTDEIFAQVDVEGLTKQALTALTDVSNLATNAPRLDQAVVGLAPVIAGQAKNFVHDTVGSLVESDEFEDLWIQANRAAHTTLVAVVTGDTGDTAVQVDDSGTVSISLGTVIDKVKTRLSERGFAFADKIPQIDKQFVLVQSPELAKAQGAVRALDKAADVLPWLTLLVAAAAIWVAPRGSRLRALAAVGVTFVVTMALLGVAILIGRSLFRQYSNTQRRRGVARAGADTAADGDHRHRRAGHRVLELPHRGRGRLDRADRPARAAAARDPRPTRRRAGPAARR